VKVIDNVTTAIIVRVDAITAPDATTPQTAADKDVAATAAAAGMSQDIFEAFAASLQARTDVNINQAAVTAVHAQLQ
jgi:peptidyl-prolyl cis-trans isomerase D